MNIDWGILGTVFSSHSILKDLINVIKPDSNHEFSIRHMVLTDSVLIEKFLNGTFFDFYKECFDKNVLFQQNIVSDFLKKTCRHNNNYNSYATWEETPITDAMAKEKNIYEITLSVGELYSLSKKYDIKVTTKILTELENENQLIAPPNFCSVEFYYDYCGEMVIESISFRQIWLVLLCIDNLHDSSLKLDGLSGEVYYPNSEMDYRSWDSIEGEDTYIKVPPLSINKNESFIVPEYIMLSPIKTERFIDQIADITGIESSLLLESKKANREYDVLDSYGFKQSLLKIDDHEELKLIGPSFSVKSISYDKREISVHKFNPNHLVSFNGIMMVGSCPHLLGWKNNEVFYEGEILTNKYNEINIEHYDYVIIAEVEDEITHIEKAIIKNPNMEKIVLENTMLEKGDFILIHNNKRWTEICISGYYTEIIKGQNNDIVNGKKVRIINKLIRTTKQIMTSENLKEIKDGILLIKNDNSFVHSF